MIIVQLLYEIHDVEFLGLLWRFSSDFLCKRKSKVQHSICHIALEYQWYVHIVNLVETSTTVQEWLGHCPMMGSSLWSMRPSSKMFWIVGHKCSRTRPTIVGLQELFPRRICGEGKWNTNHSMILLTQVMWLSVNNTREVHCGTSLKVFCLSRVPFHQDLYCCQSESWSDPPLCSQTSADLKTMDNSSQAKDVLSLCIWIN